MRKNNGNYEWKKEQGKKNEKNNEKKEWEKE